MLTLLQTVQAIAARKNPAQGMDNWILVLGEATWAAVAAGYLRNHHGFTDDWGGFKVTPAGHAFLKAHQETSLKEAPSLPSTSMTPSLEQPSPSAPLRPMSLTTKEVKRLRRLGNMGETEVGGHLWTKFSDSKEFKVSPFGTAGDFDRGAYWVSYDELPTV